MSLIGRFEHLPRRPKSDEAGPLLEKIASQVKPIMAKRSWKVGTLAEFLPSNPALLGNNMNHGQRINLRLRPPGAEGTFYEYDQLVLVMLHELTHIEHGPHDSKFYKLLAELEEEFYELKRKGYSGDGFHSDGNRIAGVKRDEYDGRRVGLAAAEKRLAVQRRIGKGGVLGGSGTAGKSIREALAEAAERRIRDDKACAAEGSVEVDAEVKKAAEESVGVDAIDLTHSSDEGSPGGPGRLKEDSPTRAKVESGEGEVPRSIPNGATQPPAPVSAIVRVGGPLGDGVKAHGKVNGISESVIAGPSKPKPPPPSSGPHKRSEARTSSGVPARSAAHPSSRTPSSAPAPRTAPVPAPAASSEWPCPTCTLLNPIHHLSCDACATERPAHYADSAARASPPNLERSAPTGNNGLGTEAGWFCGICGEGPNEWEKWSCGGCGVVRNFG